MKSIQIGNFENISKVIKENDLRLFIESENVIPILLFPYKEDVLSFDPYSLEYFDSKLALQIPCINYSGSKNFSKINLYLFKNANIENKDNRFVGPLTNIHLLDTSGILLKDKTFLDKNLILLILYSSLAISYAQVRFFLIDYFFLNLF